MRQSKLLRGGLAAVLAVMLIVAGFQAWPGTNGYTVKGQFTSAVGIYEGDEVAVLGVPVGRITSIEPQGTFTTVSMRIDKGVEIPAEADAIIVAQSLVTSRFVQLTPVHTGDGPTLKDGDEIPFERTAVPIEWDQIKTELGKLTTALGPDDEDEVGSLNRFLDVAAENLDGNGQRVRDTLRELSAAMNTLSDGSEDLFSTVRNLHVFVNALSDSNEQIVSVSGHMARVSDVLANSTAELDSSMQSLDVAVREIERFLTDHRERTGETIHEVSEVVQTLAEKRDRFGELLHVGPTGLVNFFNIYQPAQGTFTGNIGLDNFSNMTDVVCGAMGGIDGVGELRTVNQCVDMLGPLLSQFAMNYPPIGANPITGVTAYPDQVLYTDPSMHDVPGIPPQKPEPGTTPLWDADVRMDSEPAPDNGAPADGLEGLLRPGGGGN